MKQLFTQPSCAAVWGMLASTPPNQMPTKALAAALDAMVRIGKVAGQQLAAADQEAVRQLFRAALGRLDAWALASFIRFATAFKETLGAPALLEGVNAWQAAAKRGGVTGQFTPQGVSNVLLSLGTLAAWGEQLAGAIDRRLAGALWRHAVAAVGATQDARDTTNALYGASLLQLEAGAAELGVLYAAVGGRVHRMAPEDLVQVRMGFGCRCSLFG